MSPAPAWHEWSARAQAQRARTFDGATRDLAELIPKAAPRHLDLAGARGLHFVTSHDGEFRSLVEEDVLVERTFVTVSTGVWDLAVDRVGGIQAIQGRIEPIEKNLAEIQYTFWRTSQIQPPASPSEPQARTYTRYYDGEPPRISQVIPDFGIEAALKGMDFLGFSDPYEALRYMATGIGRMYPQREARRPHTITAAIGDLKKFKIKIPADAEIVGDHVVLFKE